MIQCDTCGHQLTAKDDEFRGSGKEGLAQVRKLAATEGWDSDQDFDIDWCPDCAQPAKESTDD